MQELGGRFVNWWLLGDSVRRRGEMCRAQAVLAEVNRYLLRMARLDQQQPFRPTPSRLAEAELSATALERYRRTTAPADEAALGEAYREAWTWGRELCRGIADRWQIELPTPLLKAIDERAGTDTEAIR